MNKILLDKGGRVEELTDRISPYEYEYEYIIEVFKVRY